VLGSFLCIIQIEHTNYVVVVCAAKLEYKYHWHIQGFGKDEASKGEFG
jgi:hypothetical protein